VSFKIKKSEFTEPGDTRLDLLEKLSCQSGFSKKNLRVFVVVKFQTDIINSILLERKCMIIKRLSMFS